MPGDMSWVWLGLADMHYRFPSSHPPPNSVHLSCQHRGVFNDGLPHAPVLICCQVLHSRQQCLSKQLNANDLWRDTLQSVKTCISRQLQQLRGSAEQPLNSCILHVWQASCSPPG